MLQDATQGPSPFLPSVSALLPYQLIKNWKRRSTTLCKSGVLTRFLANLSQPFPISFARHFGGPLLSDWLTIHRFKNAIQRDGRPMILGNTEKLWCCWDQGVINIASYFLLMNCRIQQRINVTSPARRGQCKPSTVHICVLRSRASPSRMHRWRSTGDWMIIKQGSKRIKKVQHIKQNNLGLGTMPHCSASPCH